jgi:hypothetical protein
MKILLRKEEVMKQLVADRRVRLVVLAAVLVVSLVALFAATPAEARVCIGSFEGGYWYCCCPTLDGGWYCWVSSTSCANPPGP